MGATGAGVGAAPGAAVGGMAGYLWGVGQGTMADMAKEAYAAQYRKAKETLTSTGEPMSESAAQLSGAISGLGTYFIGQVGAGKVSEATMQGLGNLYQTSLASLMQKPTMTAAVANFGKNVTLASGEGAAISGAMHFASTIGDQTARLLTPNISTILTDPAQQLQFKDQMEQTMLEGMALFPFLKGPGIGLDFAGDALRARQATMDAASLKALTEGVAGSKTRNRNLDAFTDFFRRQTEGSPLENISVDGKAVFDLYQKAGIADPLMLDAANDPLLGWLPDRDAQLREAKATGGEIIIPAADFTARMGGAPAFETLLPDLRMRQDGMTLREAEHAQSPEGQAERLQAFADTAKRHQEKYADALTETEPKQRVWNDVYGQAIKAGVPAPEAMQDASIEAARYATRSERSGGYYADAWAAYKKSDLNIRRGEDGEGAKTLHQAAMKRSDSGEIKDFVSGVRGGNSPEYFDKITAGEKLKEATGKGDLVVNVPSDFVRHVDARRLDKADALYTKMQAVLDNPDDVVLTQKSTVQRRGDRYTAVKYENGIGHVVVGEVLGGKGGDRFLPVTTFEGPEAGIRNALEARRKRRSTGPADDSQQDTVRAILSQLDENISTPADGGKSLQQGSNALRTLPRGGYGVFGKQSLEGISPGLLKKNSPIKVDHLMTQFGLTHADQVLDALKFNRGAAEAKHIQGLKATLNQEDSLPHTPEENASRGHAAIENVITHKTDALDAMFRPEVGSISLYWGNPGTKTKDFRDGDGVSHLIARRELEGQDGHAVAHKMADVLAHGEFGDVYGKGTRVNVTYDGHTAVLSLYRFEGRETWLLTGWKDSASDSDGGGYGPSTDTHPDPMRTRTGEGAEASSTENINPLGADGKKLFEGSVHGPRGSLTLPAGGYGTGSHIVNLFAARDKSTMLHEGAHMWLKELIHDASLPGMAEGVRNDLKTVTDWFAKNVDSAKRQIWDAKDAAEKDLSAAPNDPLRQARAAAAREAVNIAEAGGLPDFAQTLGQGMDPAVRMALLTPFHEMFARTFEGYMMKGEAPSIGLREVFQNFRSWLTRIYEKIAGPGRQMAGLTAAGGMPVDISPEVKGVMDRLLATDEQIAQARQSQRLGRMFDSAEKSGLTSAEFAEYNRLVSKARDEAQANVAAKAIRQQQDALEAEKGELADTFRVDVEAAVNARKDFQALHYLSTGKRLGAEDTGETTARMLLDKDALVALIGQESLARLPKNIYRINGGVDPQFVAEMFGYRSGSELVRDLLSLEKDKQGLRKQGIKASVRENVIQDGVIAKLKEHFGDSLTDGTMPQEAMDAIHNDTAMQALSMELMALTRLTGQRRGFLSDAKAWAADTIGNTRVSDASRLSAYERSEAKAGREAELALQKGDLEAALEAKKQQLTNHALYVEAKKSSESVDKLTADAKRYAKNRTYKSMDQGALDQIHGLLERFGLKDVAPQAKRDSLESYVAGIRDNEGKVDVPLTLFDPTLPTNFGALTMYQSEDLRTAITSLAHVGREAKKITVNGKRVDFDEQVRLAVEVAIQNNTLQDVPLERNPDKIQGTPGQKLKGRWLKVGSTLRGLGSEGIKIEQFTDWLDGHNSNGPWNSVIFRRVAQQEAYANDLRARTNTMQKELNKIYSPAERKTMSLYLPDILELIDAKTGAPLNVTKAEFLALAANTGNASNLGKMLKGEGWTREGLQDALNRHMTENDWRYVQGVWDLFEALRPEIAAREKRMQGVEPVWIENTPVQTPFGEFRGGYYPMAYDGSRAADVADRMISDAEKALFANQQRRPTTDKGYTKERVEGYARPIELSLDVIPRHINQVIADLAWREYVFDTMKFISDPRIRDVFARTIGKEAYREFKPWLNSLVADGMFDVNALNYFDRFIRRARINTTMVGLGYRSSTMLVHGSTALENSIGEIGGKWMWEGSKKFFGSAEQMAAARDFVYERSGEMRHRMNRSDRDLSDGLRDLELKDGFVDGARRFAFHGVAMLDMASAMPTWIGAYEKALASPERGGLALTEPDAIAYADKAVRNAHGGGNAKKLPHWQRGSELMKTTEMFYSFWNHFYNRQVNLARDAGRAVKTMDPALFASVLARSWWYFVAPQITHGLIHALIKDGLPKEDESWVGWLGKEIGLGLFSGIPLVRDAAAWAIKDRRSQITPSEGLGRSVAGSARDIRNAVSAEHENSPRVLKHSLETAGSLFGLPLGQLTGTSQYLWDVMPGDEDPEGVSDFMRGVAFGPAPKDTQRVQRALS